MSQERKTINSINDPQEHYLLMLEKERSDIAREMHDNIGTLLAALRMEIHNLADEADVYIQPKQNIYRCEDTNRQNITRRPSTAAELSAVRVFELLDVASFAVRQLCMNLHASRRQDELGFLISIRREIANIQNKHLHCSVHCIKFSYSLNNLAATILLRIIRKILAYESQSSETTEVNIEVTVDEQGFLLSIKDNFACNLSNFLVSSAPPYIVDATELVRYLEGTITVKYTKQAGGRLFLIEVPKSKISEGFA